MSTRCPATKPAYPGVQCVKTKGEHYEHLGWIGDDEVTWSSRPTGPQTDVGWMAAAWELTGALGLEVRVGETDEQQPALVIDGEDFKKWWDKRSEAILSAWEQRHTTLGEQLREMYDNSPAWNDPLGKRLQEQSAERLMDAAEAGAMKSPPDYCPITDCGCTGEAHP